MTGTPTLWLWKGAWRGCASASGYWLLDALIHRLALGAPLLEALVPRSGYELLMRAFTSLLIAVGTVVVYFFSMRRGQAERRLLRLATAIENAQETVVITDLEGCIEYANPAFTRITGYDREEALGQNPRVLSSGMHDRAFFEDLWTTLLARETWKGRFINRKKDESLYTEEASISPIREADGRVSGYVAVKRDVTAEDALRVQLAKAREHEVLGRFFTGIAHEIRNPLHAIQASATVLHDPGLPPSERAEWLDLIGGLADRLAALTRDLLDLAEPGSGGAPVEMDLAPLLEGAIRRVADRWPALTPSVRMFGADHGVRVAGAPRRLERVFAELIENACQSGASPVSVEVRVEREGTDAVVRIRDGGAGIPAKHREDVFLPFFTLRRGGTGLGLPIAQFTLEQHSGTLALYDNLPPPGITAEVRLPIARGDAPPRRGPQGERTGAGRGED